MSQKDHPLYSEQSQKRNNFSLKTTKIAMMPAAAPYFKSQKILLKKQ